MEEAAELLDIVQPVFLPPFAPFIPFNDDSITLDEFLQAFCLAPCWAEEMDLHSLFLPF